MKRLAFGVSAAAMLLMSGAVQAAGAGTVEQAPVGNWAGVYVGGHVGGGWGQTTDSLDCGDGDPIGSISWLTGSGVGCDGIEPIAVTALHNQDGAPWYTYDDLSDMQGWLAGGQIGALFQSGKFVGGAELSGSLTSISDTGVTQLYPLYSSELSEFGGLYEGSMDVNWIVAATGKLGFAINDKFMVSAFGGPALAGTKFASSAGYSDEEVIPGFTAGGQIDFKLTDKISAFGAYNHYWFNNAAYQGTSLFGLISNFHEYDIGLDTVRVGLNYNID